MHPKPLSKRERKVREDLKRDLARYAAKCLTIRTKAGAVMPLVFNRVQQHLHERLEEQRARTGRVRALVLKFRQPAFRPTSPRGSITAPRTARARACSS